MGKFWLAFIVIFFCSCRTTSFFVVRHAQKEVNTMTSDVPLSEEGKRNAQLLKSALAGEKIQDIYSTNYIRTRSTVQPFADHVNLPVQTYQPLDSVFFKILRYSNRNTLIAGHSNTVDDIVNHLLGYKHMSDLPDEQYGDLFIIKKKGNKFKLEKKSF